MSDDGVQPKRIHRHVFSRTVDGHDEEWFIPRIVAADHVRGVILVPMNRVAPVARMELLPVPIPEEWEWHEVEVTPA